MHPPRLTIIVCTYNRADLLEKCLVSLAQQRLSADSFEVIVVDNNSTDNTAAVVSRYTAVHPHFRHVIELKQGHSHARNRGCEEAQSEYLAYLDDDAMAPPEYVANLIKVIAAHQPDICGGPIYPYYTSPKPRWFKDKYEIRKYADQSGFSFTCSISGSNFIIRKGLLKQLGMFDANFGMQGGKTGLLDERKVVELYRRYTPLAEQKVYYALECYVEHYVPEHKMTLKDFLRRSYTGGRAWVQLNNQLKTLPDSNLNGKSSTQGKPKTPVWPLARLPLRAMQIVFQSVRTQGVTGIDYINAARIATFHVGTIVERINQALHKSQKAS